MPSESSARASSGSREPTAAPRSFNKIRLALARPLYLLAIGAQTSPIFAGDQPGPGRWIRPLGLVCLGLGVATRVWALGVLRKKRALARTGPYAHTRNPLYLGTFGIGLGLCLAASWPWSLGLACLHVALFRWLYARQIAWEEYRLAPIFGAAYRDYLENVPRFWPRRSPWRAPDASGGFSLGVLLRNHGASFLVGAVGLLLLMDFTSGVVWPVLRGEVGPGTALAVHYTSLQLFRGAP